MVCSRTSFEIFRSFEEGEKMDTPKRLTAKDEKRILRMIRETLQRKSASTLDRVRWEGRMRVVTDPGNLF
jgi:hypothetical protein